MTKEQLYKELIQTQKKLIETQAKLIEKLTTNTVQYQDVPNLQNGGVARVPVNLPVNNAPITGPSLIPPYTITSTLISDTLDKKLSY